jgi:hypothetical protein
LTELIASSLALNNDQAGATELECTGTMIFFRPKTEAK